MATEPRQRLTIPEYLAFERQAEVRNEYLDGEVFAMSGASREHNRLALNLASGLDAALKSRGCEVFVSDMRVRTPDTAFFTYPDVAVACGGAEFDSGVPDTLLNPVLLIEVLSPTTEAYDRGAKFAHYRSIPTLAAYVLVAQDRVHVEHYQRQDGGGWLMIELDGLDQILELASVGCRLRLADVYDRVFAA